MLKSYPRLRTERIAPNAESGPSKQLKNIRLPSYIELLEENKSLHRKIAAQTAALKKDESGIKDEDEEHVGPSRISSPSSPATGGIANEDLISMIRETRGMIRGESQHAVSAPYIG